MNFNIREGLKADLPQVLELIKELADYENAIEEVQITVEELENDGFGKHPLYYFLVAEEKNQIIGLSFYHIRYSTWKGKFLLGSNIITSRSTLNAGLENSK